MKNILLVKNRPKNSGENSKIAFLALVKVFQEAYFLSLNPIILCEMKSNDPIDVPYHQKFSPQFFFSHEKMHCLPCVFEVVMLLETL